MRTTLIKNGLAAACALALGVLSTAAASRPVQEDEHALVRDSSGAPVMTGTGDCLRSGFGPAPAWTRECHGDAPPTAALDVVPGEGKAVSPTPAAVVAPAVVAPAAALVVWETVAFDANVLFDSDKSALRPLGRDKLDQFVDKIHGLDSQNILAIGYSDRMGTKADNQALSQRRVDTVKSYLVGKGIAADRVQTSARGETQPNTSAGECKDAKNAKNITCMQPDRHVYIEVSGTRIAN